MFSIYFLGNAFSTVTEIYNLLGGGEQSRGSSTGGIGKAKSPTFSLDLVVPKQLNFLKLESKLVRD